MTRSATDAAMMSGKPVRTRPMGTPKMTVAAPAGCEARTTGMAYEDNALRRGPRRKIRLSAAHAPLA